MILKVQMFCNNLVLSWKKHTENTSWELSGGRVMINMYRSTLVGFDSIQSAVDKYTN